MNELFKETYHTFTHLLECLFLLTVCAICTMQRTLKWAWSENIRDVKRGTATILFLAALPLLWMLGLLTKTDR